MKKIGLIFVVFLMTSSAFAQKIKVKKVRGNQAVVEFSGEPLVTGEVYELNSDSFAETSGSDTRDHLLGLQFSMQTGKSDVPGAKSSTVIDLSARYGWNHGTFEFGPIFSYVSDNSSGNTASILTGGAFGDFNLIPNSSGEVFIYGVGGTVRFGTNDSGSGTSTTLMSVAAGPVVKWFMYSGAFALRLDGLYEYNKYSSNAGDTTYSGFKLLAGIATYF